MNHTLTMPTQDKLHERIRWACRRGMLELDLFLVPFFEQQYVTLNEEEKQIFQKMLSETDPDLFAWLMGHNIPANQEFIKLVEKIRSYRSLTDNDPFV